MSTFLCKSTKITRIFSSRLLHWLWYHPSVNPICLLVTSEINIHIHVYPYTVYICNVHCYVHVNSCPKTSKKEIRFKAMSFYNVLVIHTYFNKLSEKNWTEWERYLVSCQGMGMVILYTYIHLLLYDDGASSLTKLVVYVTMTQMVLSWNPR